MFSLLCGRPPESLIRYFESLGFRALQGLFHLVADGNTPIAPPLAFFFGTRGQVTPTLLTGPLASNITAIAEYRCFLKSQSAKSQVCCKSRSKKCCRDAKRGTALASNKVSHEVSTSSPLSTATGRGRRISSTTQTASNISTFAHRNRTSLRHGIF